MWNNKNFLQYSGETICASQELVELLPPTSKLLHSNDRYHLLSDFSYVSSLFFFKQVKIPEIKNP